MGNNKQSNNQNASKYQNVLESLKSLETNVKQTVKQEAQEFEDTAFNQIFGPGSKIENHRSGVIEVGESIKIDEILSGEREKVESVKKQFFVEKRLLEEEKIRVQEKTNMLRMQLKVIMDEVVVLSQSTQELGDEVRIAAMQAPIDPGEYHVAFFEKLLDYVRSFRKKIEKASTWLHVSNKRAQKKNYWAQYKKHGAKFLLSGESYSSRSAG